MALAFHPSSQEADVEGSWVSSQAGLYSKICLRKQHLETRDRSFYNIPFCFVHFRLWGYYRIIVGGFLYPSSLNKFSNRSTQSPLRAPLCFDEILISAPFCYVIHWQRGLSSKLCLQNTKDFFYCRYPLPNPAFLNSQCSEQDKAGSTSHTRISKLYSLTQTSLLLT